MNLRLSVLTLALLGGASLPAMAAEATLQELLNDGFVIVGTDVVPIEVVQRAVDPGWKDDYFLTLQNGNRIALCHATLQSTVDANAVTPVTCSVSDAGAKPSTKPAPRLPKPPQ